MYAYGNHIQVRGAEASMSTCDSEVAITFLQSCRSSSSDKNMKTTNLEYVGWVDEIISTDYMKYEVVVLYCTWAQTNKREARATMKCDEWIHIVQIRSIDSIFSEFFCISFSRTTSIFCRR